MRATLALDNAFVQQQVTGDYNFHSEEQFKVNYWCKVVQALADGDSTQLDSKSIRAVSCDSIRAWWKASVQNRSLPGLEKVLTVALREENRKMISQSTVMAKYENLFLNSSDPHSTSVGSSSIVAKLYSVAGGVYRRLVGGADSTTAQVSSSDIIASSELLYFLPAVEAICEHCIDKLLALHIRQPDQPVLLTESELINCLKKLALSSDGLSGSVSPPMPTVVALLGLFMTKTGRGAVFTLNVEGGVKCFKILPRSGDKTAAPVVDESDKAKVMHQLALVKLQTEEDNLSSRWTDLDNRVKEFLRKEQKPMALACLRERRNVEKRLEDIHTYRLKLMETFALVETAALQNLVVDALAESNRIGKLTVNEAQVERVTKVMGETEELRLDVNAVADVFRSNIENVDSVQEDEVLSEYEKLVREQEDEKLAKREELLDNAPAPPTDLPARQVDTAKSTTSLPAPQLVFDQ